MIFVIRGITEFRPTPPSLRERVGEQYRWYRTIKLMVRLPREGQNTKSYPGFSERLIAELPELSVKKGGLTCGSTENFASHLRHGTSMGHVWEHVYAFSFDYVSSALGYGTHAFRWQTKAVLRKDDHTIYRVRMFHEVEPPPEFHGLEMIVCGYLNTLLENGDFPLRKRLSDFVSHRTLARPNTSAASGHQNNLLCHLRCSK
jgi:hypothetical protein